MQLVILGVKSKCVVPDWMLRLANDRVAWDKYPWGLYVCPTLYSQLRNTVVKRWSPLYVDEPTDEDDSKKYSIFGYTWAFKTWILESYRVTAITYFDRYNRYPRVAAWNKKKGRFLGPMGNMSAARLTPDDNEARSDWWISSRAYFDGFIGQVERVPFDLSRQNMYEISSDIYREFDEQKREIERNKKEVHDIKEEMRKFREEMKGGPSSFQGHVNSSYFNMGTPPNFQTPMPSQPGSSVWQRQMPAQSATQYWQPGTSSQPGSYYSFGRVPSHMGRQNLQTTIETHDDVDGIFDQNIPNREKKEQFPGKYKLTPFTEQPPTTILPKQRVNKTKNKGKKANLSPLNLGGAFEDDNVEENNHMNSWMELIIKRRAADAKKKLDSEFSEEENKLEMADTQAEIILSQGLPRHIFNNLNQTSTAKEIWDNVEMLMQGSGRTIQQRKEDLFTQTQLQLIDEHQVCQQPSGYWGEQSTSIVDPLAYVAHTTSAPALSSPSTPSPQHTAQSPNDWYEPIQRKALGNVGNTGARGKKDKALMMEDKRKEMMLVVMLKHSSLMWTASHLMINLRHDQYNQNVSSLIKVAFMTQNVMRPNAAGAFRSAPGKELLDSDAETEIDEHNFDPVQQNSRLLCPIAQCLTVSFVSEQNLSENICVLATLHSKFAKYNVVFAFAFAKIVDMHAIGNTLKFLNLTAEISKQEKLITDLNNVCLSRAELWSKGRTVADSIDARLTRPTVYKFKTDCSIIPVWGVGELSQEINNHSVPTLISQAPGPSRKRSRSPSSSSYPDTTNFSDDKPASETPELNPEDMTARLEDMEVEIDTLHADTEDKELLISELQDSLAAAEKCDLYY
ncbi:hypothetical protein Tco_1146189 [Tanacetum coccineum]